MTEREYATYRELQDALAEDARTFVHLHNAIGSLRGAREYCCDCGVIAECAADIPHRCEARRAAIRRLRAAQGAVTALAVRREEVAA